MKWFDSQKICSHFGGFIFEGLEISFELVIVGGRLLHDLLVSCLDNGLALLQLLDLALGQDLLVGRMVFILLAEHCLLRGLLEILCLPELLALVLFKIYLWLILVFSLMDSVPSVEFFNDILRFVKFNI